MKQKIAKEEIGVSFWHLIGYRSSAFNERFSMGGKKWRERKALLRRS
jgi:hypothetical protein